MLTLYGSTERHLNFLVSLQTFRRSSPKSRTFKMSWPPLIKISLGSWTGLEERANAFLRVPSWNLVVQLIVQLVRLSCSVARKKSQDAEGTKVESVAWVGRGRRMPARFLLYFLGFFSL